MKFFHTLRQDLNKTVLNIGFVGAALMTCVLAFTASAYMDTTTDKSYTVIEAFLTFDKKFVESDYTFASMNVFSKALSGYISMFIPIIVAFPFMVSFCAERNNGLMRFTITRAGKLRYYLSKFTASLLGGGLAVAFGMILFGIVVRIAFPSIYSYGLDPESLQWTVPNGEMSIVWRVLLSSFIYGAFSTLPAFFLSSFCRNPYIITCLPFMLVYVWQTAISKLITRIFDLNASFDQNYMDRLTAFAPDSSRYLASVDFGELTYLHKCVLIFNGAYLAVFLIGFIVIMNLRTDQGS